MNEKYILKQGTKLLFEVTYEFSSETEKDQVLAALSLDIKDIKAVRSFTQSQSFKGTHALEWLRANSIVVSPQLEQYLKDWKPVQNIKKARPLPVSRTLLLAESDSTVAISPSGSIDFSALLNLPVIREKIYKVWFGTHIICDSPLKFKSDKELEKLLSALKSVSYNKVRAEEILDDSEFKIFSGHDLLNWLGKRQDVNNAVLREILKLPYTAQEKALLNLPVTREKIYKVWFGVHIICNSPLKFKSDKELEKLLSALKSVSYNKVRAEEILDDSEFKIFSGYDLLEWLGKRQDVNKALLREILQLPYTTQEKADIEKERETREKMQREKREAAYLKEIKADLKKSEERITKLAHKERQAANISQTLESSESLESHKFAIMKLAQGRKIPYLVHFTRLENLFSIIENGIRSRRLLGTSGYIWNDDVRLDGRLHANCLSISHPNYKMFWQHRQQNVNSEWVVLKVATEILWELDCGFVETNAGKRSIDIHLRPEGSLKTARAFDAMFSHQDPNLRHTLNLEDYETTDPQAEVLVFETILPPYIKEICVNKALGISDTRILRAAQIQNIPVVHNPAIFLPRHDYQHWQRR